MDEPIGVGVVGPGAIADIHFASISMVRGARVVAVAARHALTRGPWASLPQVHGVGDLAARADVDVILICTPSDTHFALAQEALRLGRHVVIEKPIALHPGEAREIAELASTTGLVAACISQARYGAQMTEVISLLRSGRLGRPVLAQCSVHWYRDQAYYERAAWRASWAGSGGVLGNQAYHMIDLMCWAFGPASEVHGIDGVIAHEIESPDTAVVAIRFASGALGTISASTATPPGSPEGISLYFDRGYLTFMGGEIAAWSFDGVPRPEGAATGGSGASDPLAIGAAGHAMQWDDIVGALREGRDPLFTASDAIAVVDVIARARRQA